jgi:Mg-chelatase subunit ChlD
VDAADAFTGELAEAAFVAHVALVTYGDSAKIDSAMSGDFSRVATGLRAYTQAFKSGNTNIGDGIVKGEAALAKGRDFASKVVVVMTDGIRTTGPDPVPLAQKLGDKGVIVFTVTFSDEADVNLMKRVAEKGMGQHFHAKDANALAQVFATIARKIPTILTH